MPTTDQPSSGGATCSVSQVGDREWWCSTHRRDAEARAGTGAGGGVSGAELRVPDQPTTEGDKVSKPGYVYVASSWRNPMQPGICAALRSAKIDHYDFRNPEPGNDGFRWTDVDPDWSRECRCDHTRGAHGFCAAHGEAPTMGRGCSCPQGDGTTSPESYLRAIEHPVAIAGYDLDFAAMDKADTFVLVLPCGRSAHLELGWAVGQGKRTAILLDDPVTPELMYRMVDYVAPSLFDLLGWLGVED